MGASFRLPAEIDEENVEETGVHIKIKKMHKKLDNTIFIAYNNETFH